MSVNQLRIPLLIRDHPIGETVFFAVRPIFVPTMVVLEARFDQAIERIKKNYLQLMGQTVAHRKQLNDVLLPFYHPQFKFQKIPLEFKLENIYVKGDFSIVVFEEAGYTFVQFPFVNGHVFIAKNSIKQRDTFRSEVARVLQQVLLGMKQSDEDFRVEDFYSSNKEFIHYIDLPNLFKSGSFPDSTKDALSLFGFQQDDDFDGLSELYKIGYNYSEQYPDRLKRAFFQDEMVDRLKEMIFDAGQSAIVLLGELGIGKHTIISEVVYRYLEACQSDEKYVQCRNIWRMDPLKLIAGMSYVGSWQRRLNAIITHLQSPSKDCESSDILLIDNPVAILDIGKSANNSMAIKDVLKPLLEKKSLSVILLATPDEWKVIEEKDRGLSTLFQVVRLQEPDESLAVKILLKKRAALEKEYGTSFMIQAIAKIIDLYRGYRKGEVLPGSLISHLERIATKRSGQEVDVIDVLNEFSEMSGLSESVIRWNEGKGTDYVTRFFRDRIFGQPKVVETLVNVTHLILAKLTDENKPYSSLLFVGPTGVGKTHAAKVLAEYIMGSEKALIRFDMNEFIGYYDAERLIGTTAKPDGILTERLRHHPYGVILFDEIEKAHPNVLDLMLQILDEGQLTDGIGRKVDFTKTVIIMTSNVGASDVGTQVGFGEDDKENYHIFMRAIRNRFRPEWVNRIDEMIVFDSLQKEQLVQIAHRQIQELLHREGFLRRMTILNIAPEVLRWIADRGYDPKMGGRSLKRQIENDLTRLTADYLIEINDGAPIIISIELKDNALHLAVIQLTFPPVKPRDLLPDIPAFERGGYAYRRLLSRISGLERIVSEKAPVHGEAIQRDEALRNWKYYDFQTNITDLKTALTTIKNGFNDSHFRRKSALRIRSRYVDWMQGAGTNIIDLLQEALSRSFFKVDALLDDFSSEYINYFLKVHLLELQTAAFVEGNWQVVDFRFIALVQERSQPYIAYLFDKYKALFEFLNILKSHDPEKKSLTIEGYGVWDLVRNEQAIHLFLTRQSYPVPIQVEVFQNGKKRKTQTEMKVGKVYQYGQTMLDLKSGLLNLYDFNTEEHLLMLYMGIIGNQ